MGVPVSEQNIEVHSKHCTVTKDTFGSCDVWIRGRETNGKHKTFNVLPSDPDLHFAFTLSCLSPCVFLHHLPFVLFFGFFIDGIAHIY